MLDELVGILDVDQLPYQRIPSTMRHLAVTLREANVGPNDNDSVAYRQRCRQPPRGGVVDDCFVEEPKISASTVLEPFVLGVGPL